MSANGIRRAIGVLWGLSFLLLSGATSASCKSAVRVETRDSVGTGVVATYHGATWFLTAYHVLRGVSCDPGKECVHLLGGPNQVRLNLSDVTKVQCEFFRP
jgi:hypothetical protein